jgi:hypothetical protein
MLHKDAGTIPDWCSDILRGVETIDIGGRHAACYRLGATLSQCGWSERDIVAAILETRLRDIGTEDIRRCVGNGSAAAER